RTVGPRAGRDRHLARPLADGSEHVVARAGAMLPPEQLEGLVEPAEVFVAVHEDRAQRQPEVLARSQPDLLYPLNGVEQAAGVDVETGPAQQPPAMNEGTKQQPTPARAGGSRRDVRRGSRARLPAA